MKSRQGFRVIWWVGSYPAVRPRVGARETNEVNCLGRRYYMDVSKNGGTQQPWVFLLKMIILGCFGGTTIEGNNHMRMRHFLK